MALTKVPLDQSPHLEAVRSDTPARTQMSLETDLMFNDRHFALSLPSGKRIFELARQAIEIEKSHSAGSCLSYELFIADLCEQTDDAMWRMDSAEKRFFQTLFARKVREARGPWGRMAKFLRDPLRPKA